MNPLQKLAASALIACSTLIVTPAAAHDHSSDSITINHPWSRPTPPGVPMGVGYMVITNHSDSDITPDQRYHAQGEERLHSRKHHDRRHHEHAPSERWPDHPRR